MQYTLLYMESENKVVKQKVFLSMQDLKDFKNYGNSRLKSCELIPVDRDGYVWFCEITE